MYALLPRFVRNVAPIKRAAYRSLVLRIAKGEPGESNEQELADLLDGIDPNRFKADIQTCRDRFAAVLRLDEAAAMEPKIQQLNAQHRADHAAAQRAWDAFVLAKDKADNSGRQLTALRGQMLAIRSSATTTLVRSADKSIPDQLASLQNDIGALQNETPPLTRREVNDRTTAERAVAELQPRVDRLKRSRQPNDVVQLAIDSALLAQARSTLKRISDRQRAIDAMQAKVAKIEWKMQQASEARLTPEAVELTA